MCSEPDESSVSVPMSPMRCDTESLPKEHTAILPPQNDARTSPIYHNANITLVTCLVLIMSFALKHNLTDAALQDLLCLISYLIPTPNTFISSLYSFKKYFAATQLNSTRIYYCKVCKSSTTDMLASHCSTCNEPFDFKTFFISICIKEQLKNLFERPGFYTSLQHRFSRNIPFGNLADIYDGTLYQSLFKRDGFLSFKSNISFQWNTDGVPLFSSSSFSMWPLYLKINELPYVLRNSVRNKILAGVWFGNTKPSVNTFLKPLCETMNNLFYEGLLIHPPEPIRCKAIILSGTCDIPAKAMALNMIGHNGFFACRYCEQPKVIICWKRTCTCLPLYTFQSYWAN